MKIITRLVLLSVLICACKQKIHSAKDYPETINIDTSAYPALQKQFNLRGLWKAPNYLGGLKPNYPIAIGYIDCTNVQAKPDTDWMSGGMFCLFAKLIVKKGTDYSLINSRTELKSIYTPITSPQAALGYAILFTRYFAVADESFFKNSYTYYDGKPTVTSVKWDDKGYVVNLFYYQTFGCDHPYYSIVVKVYTNGTVDILSRKKVFEDPRQHNLCVD